MLTDFCSFVNFATFATCTFGVVRGGLTWGYLIKKIKYNNVIFIYNVIGAHRVGKRLEKCKLQKLHFSMTLKNLPKIESA